LKNDTTDNTFGGHFHTHILLLQIDWLHLLLH